MHGQILIQLQCYRGMKTNQSVSDWFQLNPQADGNYVSILLHNYKKKHNRKKRVTTRDIMRVKTFWLRCRFSVFLHSFGSASSSGYCQTLHSRSGNAHKKTLSNQMSCIIMWLPFLTQHGVRNLAADILRVNKPEWRSPSLKLGPKTLGLTSDWVLLDQVCNSWSRRCLKLQSCNHTVNQLGICNTSTLKYNLRCSNVAGAFKGPKGITLGRQGRGDSDL